MNVVNSNALVKKFQKINALKLISRPYRFKNVEYSGVRSFRIF